MLQSKMLDLVIGLVMAYFFYDRLKAGQTGMAILFIVLAVLNLLAFFIKLRNEKQEPQ